MASRDRAAGGGDDAHDGAGSSAAADSPVSGHCPVHFASLRAGLSLRHADVAFIAFAGGVDFTLFQCTDAAIAILAGVIGGVVAQHFGYAACFLFAGAFTLLAAWVAYIRLHSARELMTSAID